ncbi:MAG: type 1 glutamine amidotransferase [Spirochaetaceae bacterium]|nr:MAG: type 1 glutamine amidotransferase [Spirochaetaceae bacterium]
MTLNGKRALSLLHDDVEDLEFWYPTLRLREEGMVVDVAGEHARTYVGKYGVPATAAMSWDDVDPQDYDVLLVPGGWAPDRIRRFETVLAIVRSMNADGRIIGQICHAGWVLISAGILKGKRVTSTPGIRDDMTNAGAIWLDEPVVIDGNIVSSRRPPDLPDYLSALIGELRRR